MNEKKKKKMMEPTQRAMEITDVFVSQGSMKSDPNGSYTGKPIDPNEVPVQDADDL